MAPLQETDGCGRYRRGWTVCGNQRCELGEACSHLDSSIAAAAVPAAGRTSSIFTTTTTDNTNSSESACCSADCPVVVRSCPADAQSGKTCSGHGSCLTGVGECRCFEGYGGDACGTCSGQYATVLDSGGGGAVRCVLLAGMYSTCFNGVVDGLEQGVDCGGVCPSCGGTSSGADTAAGSRVVLITTTTVVGALIVGIVVAAVVMCRQRSEQQPHRSRSVVTAPLRAGRSRGPMQPSSVYPVALDVVGERRRSSIGDRVARIVGRNSIDGHGVTAGVDAGGRRGGDGGGRGIVRVYDGQSGPSTLAHCRGTVRTGNESVAPAIGTGGCGPGMGTGDGAAARRSSAAAGTRRVVNVQPAAVVEGSTLAGCPSPTQESAVVTS